MEGKREAFLIKNRLWKEIFLLEIKAELLVVEIHVLGGLQSIFQNLEV